MSLTLRLGAGRPDLTFHGLRRTSAVLAAASGATVAELMARLGHHATMAMKYQHAAADRDRVIADALEPRRRCQARGRWLSLDPPMGLGGELVVR